MRCSHVLFFFFFNDTATTEIYTLSLHDALPIFDEHHVAITGAEDRGARHRERRARWGPEPNGGVHPRLEECRAVGKDRKSTRLNSSHSQISYAVFCLKKKKNRCYKQICPYDSLR